MNNKAPDKTHLSMNIVVLRLLPSTLCLPSMLCSHGGVGRSSSSSSSSSSNTQHVIGSTAWLTHSFTFCQFMSKRSKTTCVGGMRVVSPRVATTTATIATSIAAVVVVVVVVVVVAAAVAHCDCVPRGMHICIIRMCTERYAHMYNTNVYREVCTYV